MLVHSQHTQMTLKCLYPTPGSVSGKALYSLIQVFLVLPWYHDSITCPNSKRQRDCVRSEDQCVCSAKTSSVRVLATSAKWLAKFTWAPPPSPSGNPRSPCVRVGIVRWIIWLLEHSKRRQMPASGLFIGTLVDLHLVRQAYNLFRQAQNSIQKNKIIFILLTQRFLLAQHLSLPLTQYWPRRGSSLWHWEQDKAAVSRENSKCPWYRTIRPLTTGHQTTLVSPVSLHWWPF